MPMWRNWYTHSTQNAAGNHVGSSPTIGTREAVEGLLFMYLEVGLEKEKENDSVNHFLDAARRGVPPSAPITNLFELQIQKSISKMVDFFVCEKIICSVSVYCLAEPEL